MSEQRYQVRKVTSQAGGIEPVTAWSIEPAPEGSAGDGTLAECFRTAKRLGGWLREVADGKPLRVAAEGAVVLFVAACWGLSAAALAKMAGLL